LDKLAAAGGLLGFKPNNGVPSSYGDETQSQWDDDVSSQRDMLRTVVFNIFVWMQVFNEIKCVPH